MATGTLAVLRCVFGDLLNDHILNVGHIDSTTRKRHVWFPVTNSNKIVDAVYSFFKWRDISSHIAGQVVRKFGSSILSQE